MDDLSIQSNPWWPVYEALVMHALRRLQVVYDDFNVSLERWLNDMVRHPIAENWRDEVVAFVDETGCKGLRILPGSIRVIEALIEARITGTGQFARFGPAKRARHAPGQRNRHQRRGRKPTVRRPKCKLKRRRSVNLAHRPAAEVVRSVLSSFLMRESPPPNRTSPCLINFSRRRAKKFDAAKPGEEVDIDYEAEMVQKHLFLYNEDLMVAGDVWLRFNLSSDGIARMTELINPMSLGLPMFASPAQAERARQQRSAISRRLNEQNASMDAWVTGIQVTEMVATAAGIVAGAGLLVVAAKEGGTWAVVKTVAAGAAANRDRQGRRRRPARAARANRPSTAYDWPRPSSRLYCCIKSPKEPLRRSCHQNQRRASANASRR